MIFKYFLTTKLTFTLIRICKLTFVQRIILLSLGLISLKIRVTSLKLQFLFSFNFSLKESHKFFNLTYFYRILSFKWNYVIGKIKHQLI